MELGHEVLCLDETQWTIGPYHPALPGPMVLSLKLDGEVIVNGSYETGFLYRGLEQEFEKHHWRETIPLADRLDPEASFFGELCFCLAVEEVCGVKVPERSQMIRIIISELSRISSHLLHIAKLGKSLNSDTISHFVLRDREKILDLFELLTGARFNLNFLWFGGVSDDVTDGFLERVSDVCDLIKVRIKEYNDLFSFNKAFLKRTAKVGVLSYDLAKKFGVTGPIARASGVEEDVRKSAPYSGYDKVDFSVPIGQGEFGDPGSAHDRYLLRLREITKSIDITKQVVEAIPSGEFFHPNFDPRNPKLFKIPAGESYQRIESPRGLLGCHIISDGGDRPVRVQFRSPSKIALTILPDLLKGVWVEDLPVILASLDLSIAEADR